MKAIVVFGKEDMRIMELPDISPDQGEVLARVHLGGICGSDLHYYNDGRIMNYELQEPLTLGHEISAEVLEVGSGVERVKAGQQIGVHPARPCNRCEYCHSGRKNLCPNTQFFGSAMRFPHIQGAFSQLVVLREDQCYPTLKYVPWESLTLAEPLAVGLHGVNRAGGVLGKRVLICGAGPIGQLAMLASRYKGAKTVAITDILEPPLEIARRLEADYAVNVSQDSVIMSEWKEDRGFFDVVLEAAGTDQSVETAINCAQPGAVLVQLGMSSNPINSFAVSEIITKELDFRGSFRFNDEFADAVSALEEKHINPAPLVTGVFPLEQTKDALDAAFDRSMHLKVLISF